MEDEDDDDDWLSDEEFAETAGFDVLDKKFKSHTTKGKSRQQEKGWGVRSFDSGQSPKMIKNEKVASLQPNSGVKYGRNLKENKYPRLSEEINQDEKWLPLLDY